MFFVDDPCPSAPLLLPFPFNPAEFWECLLWARHRVYTDARCSKVCLLGQQPLCHLGACQGWGILGPAPGRWSQSLHSHRCVCCRLRSHVVFIQLTQIPPGGLTVSLFPPSPTAWLPFRRASFHIPYSPPCGASRGARAQAALGEATGPPVWEEGDGWSLGDRSPAGHTEYLCL